MMKVNAFPIREGASESRYTDLFACIFEEDEGYTVEVRLSHALRRRNSAWGEEFADSVESASALIAALAEEFSIAQAHITIELRLNELTAGSRH
jgi:hypothetical protein